MTGTTTEPSPPPSPPNSDVRPGPAMPQPRRRRLSWRLLAVFALLVAAFVFLLVEGLGSSLDYFDTVDPVSYTHLTLARARHWLWAIELVAGVILIVFGVLLLTDNVNWVSTQLSNLLNDIGLGRLSKS